MSKIVIQVEQLSKQYRLGKVGTGSLAHDINRTWHRIRGKEDPYLKIGEANDRALKGTSEYVWALQDINFDVYQGEVLGIIGRNGAGKSTLLKILSRTTSPTTGSIKIKGRVASLLEVGTGFHPELTGRENIFLNGAILGMSKTEIKTKFDEIVDFAGVERYIDTPVKRYSSGMYVRLAFGVAAHLEPEILIVDEVLAVGDAEFQKKALGKMKEVSNKDGRTVLFVSHNMAALQNICSRAMLLKNGVSVSSGDPESIIDSYLKEGRAKTLDLLAITERRGTGFIRFKKAYISGLENADMHVESFKGASIVLEYDSEKNIDKQNSRVDIGINNSHGQRVAWLSTDNIGFVPHLNSGKIVFDIEMIPLSPGDYTCTLFARINHEVADWLTEVMEFNIADKDYYKSGRTLPRNQGNVLLQYTVREND